MSLTTLDQMKSQPAKRRYREETLPVNQFRVRIRSLTELEYSEYQAETVQARGQGLKRERLVDANRRFISLCLVDADGNRLLSSQQAKELMADWDSADTSFLYQKCAEHCHVDPADVEELVGNSEGTSGDDSP